MKMIRYDNYGIDRYTIVLLFKSKEVKRIDITPASISRIDDEVGFVGEPFE